MDLVSDFKTVIEENTDKCKKYMNSVYCDINEDVNASFIKDINEYYTAFGVLRSVLKSDTQKDVLLDNILLDYCRIIHCLIVNDEKLINFVYRNIIESFLRYVTGELQTRDLEGLFISINSRYKDSKEERYIADNISRIKQIYNESCLYIHTDTSKIPKDLISMYKYYDVCSTQKVNKLEATFKKLNISMLNILKLVYKTEFFGMKENARGYIDYIIPFEDRVKFDSLI